MIGSTESSIDILLGNEESEIVDNEDIIARNIKKYATDIETTDKEDSKRKLYLERNDSSCTYDENETVEVETEVPKRQIFLFQLSISVLFACLTLFFCSTEYIMIHILLIKEVRSKKPMKIEIED